MILFETSITRYARSNLRGVKVPWIDNDSTHLWEYELTKIANNIFVLWQAELFNVHQFKLSKMHIPGQ